MVEQDSEVFVAVSPAMANAMVGGLTATIGLAGLFLLEIALERSSASVLLFCFSVVSCFVYQRIVVQIRAGRRQSVRTWLLATHTGGLLLGLQACGMALLTSLDLKTSVYSVPEWGWIGLGCVWVGSGVYGYRLGRHRWRCRQDAIDTARAADSQLKVTMNTYTAGFLLLVILLVSLIGRYFGLEIRAAIVLSMLSATAPMLVASMLTSLVLVRRFFPANPKLN